MTLSERIEKYVKSTERTDWLQNPPSKNEQEAVAIIRSLQAENRDLLSRMEGVRDGLEKVRCHMTVCASAHPDTSLDECIELLVRSNPEFTHTALGRHFRNMLPRLALLSDALGKVE